MIYQLSIIPIMVGCIVLGAIYLDWQRTCSDLSATSFSQFKTGERGILPLRCSIPKPLQ